MDYVSIAKTFLDNFDVLSVRSRSESLLMLFSYLKGKELTSLDSDFLNQVSEYIVTKYPEEFRDILQSQVIFELEHYFNLSKKVVIQKAEPVLEDEIPDPEYDPDFFDEIGMEMPE